MADETIATVIGLSSTTKEIEWAEVVHSVDSVEMLSVLHWNIDNEWNGATVWTTPNRGRLVNTVLKDDRLKKINDENVSEYTKKQLTHLVEKYGNVKVNITVLRHIKNERDTSHSKSSISSEEDNKTNIELAKMEKIRVNTSLKYQDPEVQRNIYVATIVTCVSCISNVNQTFRATIVLDHEWQPMKSEVDNYIKMEENNENPDANWKPFWCPKWAFRNAMEVHSSTWEGNQHDNPFKLFQNVKGYKERGTSCIDLRDRQGFATKMPFEYLVQARLCVDATFSERMELQNFPFDVQELSLVIQEDHSLRTAKIMPHKRRFDFVSVDRENSSINDWYFRCPLAELTESDPSDCTFNNIYSQLIIRIKMERRWYTYLSRIAIFLCILSFLTLTYISIDNEDISDRLSHVVTLLLTAVAFQFITSSYLPNVSYLTLMDHYVIFSFIFIALVGVNCAIIHYFEFSKKIDTFAFFGFVVVWFIIHIYFFIKIKKAIKEEKKKLLLYGAETVAMEDASHGMALDKWKINESQQWTKEIRQRAGVKKHERVYFAHGRTT